MMNTAADAAAAAAAASAVLRVAWLRANRLKDNIVLLYGYMMDGWMGCFNEHT